MVTVTNNISKGREAKNNPGDAVSQNVAVDTRRFTRRDFLKVSTLAAGSSFFVACDGRALADPLPTENGNNEANASPEPKKATPEKTSASATKTPQNTSASNEIKKTPVPTVQIEIAPTVDPNTELNILIENARQWAGYKMGDCGVPEIKSVSLVEDIKQYVLSPNQPMRYEKADYKMAVDEQRFGDVLVKEINDKKIKDRSGAEVKMNRNDMNVAYYLMESEADENGLKKRAPFMIISKGSYRGVAFSRDDNNDLAPFGTAKSDGSVKLDLIEMTEAADPNDSNHIFLGVQSNIQGNVGSSIGELTSVVEVKTDDKKFRAILRIPPFKDNVTEHFKKQLLLKEASGDGVIEPFSTRDTGLDTIPNLYALRKIITDAASIKGIDNAIQEKNNEAVRKANKELIERNSLEKKQKEVDKSINDFFDNPNSWKEEGKQYIEGENGDRLGLNHFDEPGTEVQHRGDYYFKRTYFDVMPVLINYFACRAKGDEKEKLYLVFGATDSNGSPFVWTGSPGTLNTDYPFDSVGNNSFTSNHISRSAALRGGVEKKNSHVLQTLEKTNTGNQVHIAMYYIDKESNFYWIKGNNMGSYSSDDFDRLLNEFANKDNTMPLINSYKGSVQKADYIITSKLKNEYKVPEHTPYTSNIGFFYSKKS